MEVLALSLKIVATLFTLMAALPFGYHTYRAAHGDDPTRPKNAMRDALASAFVIVPCVFIVLVAVWF